MTSKAACVNLWYYMYMHMYMHMYYVILGYMLNLSIKIISTAVEYFDSRCIAMPGAI